MKKLLDISGWILVIIFLLSGMCSCGTLKKSQKDLNFVNANHPELLAKYCAVTFPVNETTKLIQGKDSLIRDTSLIFINCDSAISAYSKEHPNATPEEKKTAAQRVFVPFVLHDTTLRVDTLIRTVENTAKISLQQAQISTLTASVDSWQTKAKNREKWLWKLIIALGICMVWITAPLWKKLIV